ncbi:Uncharacterized protein PHPALM_16822 [Phytophthora palmivora]|uniref:Retrovirus-related Pol polyprotein from transposon TNT 1-94 n=1 Tax=Phytophthora palmivora TaxID=4796 RepID=A0A2P4XNZ4_9STRA|nr:Uncharacterized protein PHPALM_16822 [Phytophthora palmivora]
MLKRYVGSVTYLMIGICPELEYYLRKVSQFLSNPGMVHWKAVVRGLKYLGGTKDYGVLLGGIQDTTPHI